MKTNSDKGQNDGQGGLSGFIVRNYRTIPFVYTVFSTSKLNEFNKWLNSYTFNLFFSGIFMSLKYFNVIIILFCYNELRYILLKEFTIDFPTMYLHTNKL